MDDETGLPDSVLHKAPLCTEEAQEQEQEQEQSDDEADAESSNLLCSQRSLKNLLTTVGNILEVRSFCSYCQCALIYIPTLTHDLRAYFVLCQWFDFAIYGYFEPELGF